MPPATPTSSSPRSRGSAACARPGIRLLAGGDFGHQWTHHGTYAAELERYVELVGMTPIEAIHTATRNMGAVAGLDIGELRAGALADLVIVDGDPTADITVLSQPERRRAVMKDGALRLREPGDLPVTDVPVTDRVDRRAVGTILTGRRRAHTAAAPPSRARRARRAPHRDHGLGLSGLAARHLRPRPRAASATSSPHTRSITGPGSTRSWPPRPSGAARWAARSRTPASTGSPASGTARHRASTGAATC